jgi:HPt (histidine-containing phosphotransfer) domain-containing protein
VAEANMIFDSQALIDALGGDRSLAQSVAVTFLANGQALLDALADRLKANDATQAAMQAHTLKGSAASIRGKALAGEASLCELACTANDLTKANSSLKNIAHELARLNIALEQFCRPEEMAVRS